MLQNILYKIDYENNQVFKWQKCIIIVWHFLLSQL